MIPLTTSNKEDLHFWSWAKNYYLPKYRCSVMVYLGETGNWKEIYGLIRSMPFDHSGFISTYIVDLVLQT